MGQETTNYPHWHPSRVEVVLYTKDNFTKDVAEQLNVQLRSALRVAADTETVIGDYIELPCEIKGMSAKQVNVSETGMRRVRRYDVITWNDEHGNLCAQRRNLSVDGPGPWRVTSIAAIYQDHTLAWVIDMLDVDRELLNIVFEDIRPAAWNASFDRLVFCREGVNVRNWSDAMLADAILRAGTTGGEDLAFYRNLASAAKKYCDYELGGKEDTRLSYDENSPLTEDQVQYAAEDAILTAAVTEVLWAQAKKVNLTPVIELEWNAQPLIDSITFNGLPLDVQGYTTGVVEKAINDAETAAETLAILTSGKAFLSRLANWSGEENSEDGIEAGLKILRDPTRFKQFCVDLTEQCTTAEQGVASCAGGRIVEQDLFSDIEGPSVQAPFDLGNDNDIRKWISSIAPLFTLTIIATSLRDDVSVEVVEEASHKNPEQLKLWTGGKTRLVKDHQLDMVLRRLQNSFAKGVNQDLRDMAKHLLNYRDAKYILDNYGHGVHKLQPDWNVNSSAVAKEIFNTYDTQNVKSVFEKTTGTARLFGKADSLNADALKLLSSAGSQLATALLVYRTNEKLNTTYGDKFLGYVHPITKRLHSRYSQALTGTGRLSSSSPNAQNFSPKAKEYITPRDKANVMINIDLSQAELRYAANASNDTLMLEAFAAGVDLHERTASLMFRLDMAQLKSTDPERYDLYRFQAKSVSFGYAYGIGPATLAQNLTVKGVPTTRNEAADLIGKFDKAYPQLSAWMKSRVAKVNEYAEAIQSGQVEIDYERSWLLHRVHLAIKEHKGAAGGNKATVRDLSCAIATDQQLKNRAARQLGVSPEEVDDATLEAARTDHMDIISWAQTYEVPSILNPDGSVWSFTSSTEGGRLRWFPVTTSSWEYGMVTSIVGSKNAKVHGLCDRWVALQNEAAHEEAKNKLARGERVSAVQDIALRKPGRHGGTQVLDRDELKKLFENRKLRTSLVEFLMSNAPEFTVHLFRAGAADRVRAATNQYRNHPIQGGVADAMLLAMSWIYNDLVNDYPTARVVQTVHDSLVIECQRSEALEIRDLCVTYMEKALNKFCPNVVTKADGDIQRSLDKHTKIDTAELMEAK